MAHGSGVRRDQAARCWLAIAALVVAVTGIRGSRRCTRKLRMRQDEAVDIRQFWRTSTIGVDEGEDATGRATRGQGLVATTAGASS